MWLWSLAIAAGIAAFLDTWAFWFEPARLAVREERIVVRGPVNGTVRIAVLTDLYPAAKRLPNCDGTIGVPTMGSFT